jgi:hypothetical protein
MSNQFKDLSLRRGGNENVIKIEGDKRKTMNGQRCRTAVEELGKNGEQRYMLMEEQRPLGPLGGIPPKRPTKEE